jgi:hypothetical protein
MIKLMESNGVEFLYLVLMKVKIAFAMLVKSIFAIALVVLLDSAELIITTYIMIALNVLSGYVVMLYRKQKWNAEKWFKTAMKLLWFPVVIAATQWITHTNKIQIPLADLVAGFLVFHDFKGFIDNVGKLTGIDIWNAISEQIDWSKFKIKRK